MSELNVLIPTNSVSDSREGRQSIWREAKFYFGFVEEQFNKDGVNKNSELRKAKEIICSHFSALMIMTDDKLRQFISDEKKFN